MTGKRRIRLKDHAAHSVVSPSPFDPRTSAERVVGDGCSTSSSGSSASSGLPRPDTSEDLYIKGHLPVELFYEAIKLGGSAFKIYFICWHKAGLKKDNPTLYLSNQNKWLIRAGIGKDAKKRALDTLEDACLIELDRKNNACHRITILDWPTVQRKREEEKRKRKDKRDNDE